MSHLVSTLKIRTKTNQKQKIETFLAVRQYVSLFDNTI